MKRVVTIVAGLVMLALLIICNVPFSVTKTYHALEIDTVDAGHQIGREVTLRGHYMVNVFSHDRFDGTIQISGYEKEEKVRIKDGVISWKPQRNLLVEEMRDSSDRLQKVTIDGYVFLQPFLKAAVVIVGNSYTEDEAICIVTGAETYDEAKKSALENMK